MQRGFTYLGMLFLLAISSAGLAALGQMWSQAAQRERERELVFRGEAIAHAIASYVAASPAPPASAALRPTAHWPRSLDDLLEDRRGPKVLHHLRQRYADPFTRAADWVLVPRPGPAAGFAAVHSRSTQVLKGQALAEGGRPLRAMDRVFSAETAAAQDDRPR